MQPPRPFRTILTALLLAVCAVSAQGQTIKTLGFNTTNGQVVYGGTNALTFTNETVRFASGDLTFTGQTISGSGVTFSFEDGSFESGATTVRANLGFSTNLSTLWTATNAAAARSAVELGATWLTNTNVTNFRSAIGLGINDNVTLAYGSSAYIGQDGGELVVDNLYPAYISVGNFGIAFTTNAAAITRTNLGLGLPALTNTSNVTAMRALSGSTNTNHPYSGSISVVGTNNTNTLVFSNGILQEVQ